MSKLCIAVLLTIAISFGASTSHCDELDHLQLHADEVTANSGTVIGSPAEDHEEPCDHCVFCTGGVEEPTSFGVESPTTVDIYCIRTALDSCSVVHPATHRPPRL